MQVAFTCHDCDGSFTVGVDNEWGTYEFVRCPAFDAARSQTSSSVPVVSACKVMWSIRAIDTHTLAD